ncbi:MAG: AAA family ATPase, partial [Bryobacterales bacterium]|nr:AAA family ATPase [Bryobacterales bacterium]
DHMAPEQARGAPVDRRADIFAFGIVLYEMLSGVNPFRGPSYVDTISAILRADPGPISARNPELSAEFDELTARMLAKEPDQRIGSMGDVREMLARLAGTPEAASAARESVLRCRVCDAPNPKTQKFCGACGATLRDTSVMASTSQTLSAPGLSVSIADRSRRQLTVLCCGLADFGSLSERLDPEELHEIVVAFRQICTTAAQEFGGRAARPSHRTLQLYFGHPVAFEDNAARSIKAALAITNRVRERNESQPLPGGLQLVSQIGIHTGVVIVQETGTALEFTGETPDIAARLQESVHPGGIAVSALTRQLAKSAFQFQPGSAGHIGELAKNAWFKVLPPPPEAGEPDAVSGLRKTPLSGREREMGVALASWASTAEGLGQVLLISGEPGIGKSRLVDTLKDEIEKGPHLLFECRCSPYHTNTLLRPFLDFLERSCKFDPRDSSVARFGKLKAMLENTGIADDAAAPALAELLVLRVPEVQQQARLTPEEKKQSALNLLLRVVLEPAKLQPVVLIVEDLHWADPTTIELLHLIIERTSEAPVLTVLTFRPEFRHPFSALSHLLHLTVTRLTGAQTRRMVEAIAGDGTLPDAVIDQICAKTDGVPLFVEEVTRMVLESENAGEQLEIPVTLRDSLMARLDRMADAKTVAQVGAVLGREFTPDLLAAIWPHGTETLQAGLKKLAQAELLFRRGVGAQEKYVFKHALIHDIAYESLLKSTRQQYHRTTAETMERDFPRIVESQPELLAQHYTAAGMVDRASRWLERAAQQAIEHSAYRESINYLNQALTLVKALPATEGRDKLELSLQIALGAPLIAARGYAAAEVENAFLRARELSGATGRPRMRFRVQWGLGAVSLVRARLAAARELVLECLHLAEEEEDPGLLLEAESWLGTILFYLNDLPGARSHLERALELYAPAHHHTHAFLYGLDPGVLAAVHLSWLHWLMGALDEAAAMNRRSLEMAEQVGHSLSFAHALNFNVVYHCFRGDAESAAREAETEIALSNKHGFPHYLAYAQILHGWSLARQGKHAKGIEQMRLGLDSRRKSTGAELARPFFLTLLAEALGAAGSPEDGLEALREAKQVVSRTGEQWWAPEIRRLEGELLLLTGFASVEDVLTSVQEALQSASQSGSRSLELRAAISQFRICSVKAPAQLDDARKILRRVLAHFSRSAGTSSVNEATQLLQAHQQIELQC